MVPFHFEHTLLCVCFCVQAIERGCQFVLLGSAPDPKVQAEFDALANELGHGHERVSRLDIGTGCACMVAFLLQVTFPGAVCQRHAYDTCKNAAIASQVGLAHLQNYACMLMQGPNGQPFACICYR